MKKLFALVFVLLISFSPSAFSQARPNTVTIFNATTTSNVALMPDSSRNTLTIHNPASVGGDSIAYCFFAPGSNPCVAVVNNNTNGSFTLAAGGFAFWPTNSAPNGGIAIIGVGSDPVTLTVGH
jgi:hypothetical protein